MTTINRIFIPTLWVEESTASGITMSQVSSLLSTELTKRTADLLKTDGTRSMKSNFDLDNCTVQCKRGVTDI